MFVSFIMSERVTKCCNGQEALSFFFDKKFRVLLTSCWSSCFVSPNMTATFEPAKIVEHFGGKKKLHDLLRKKTDRPVSMAAISQWLARGRVPSRQLAELSVIAGKSFNLRDFLVVEK